MITGSDRREVEVQINVSAEKGMPAEEVAQRYGDAVKDILGDSDCTSKKGEEGHG